jgi:hypothetical protein
MRTQPQCSHALLALLCYRARHRRYRIYSITGNRQTHHRATAPQMQATTAAMRSTTLQAYMQLQLRWRFL